MHMSLYNVYARSQSAQTITSVPERGPVVNVSVYTLMSVHKHRMVKQRGIETGDTAPISHEMCTHAQTLCLKLIPTACLPTSIQKHKGSCRQGCLSGYRVPI